MKKTMAFGLAVLLAAPACVRQGDDVGQGYSYADKFTNIDAEWAVTADEAYEWALVKDANLPAMTGSPEWNNYFAFL